MRANDDDYRFGFGKNWQRFLIELEEHQIAQAEQSLQRLLDNEHLDNRSFLDIGSGSGLFSLAARRLGARVVSFDLDPDSVACTRALRHKYLPNDADWEVKQGSILDPEFLACLGEHDIVYAWGVLHHTGAMWQAVDNACGLVGGGGKLLIALYNDQGLLSRHWRWVKKQYNRLPWLQKPLQILYAPYFIGLAWIVQHLRRHRRRKRGMKLWVDMVDWLGGYPFEVAAPDAVVERVSAQGLAPINHCLVGWGAGCNEYLFQRRIDTGSSVRREQIQRPRDLLRAGAPTGWSSGDS